MFGYVKIDKPEMKIKDYEAYRAFYCTLCRAMCRHYGLIAGGILSYDITFLVLMRLSFAGVMPSFKKGTCQYNPTKKCNYCCEQEDEMKYAASVSMMLFYYKVRDNIADSKFFKKLLMYLIYPWAKRKFNKARKFYPEIAEAIGGCMDRQSATEKENTASCDRAAHESADALGKIFSFGMKDNKNEIYRFGYAVGKWVYLVDAADDIGDDIKDKSFNVFVNKYTLDSIYSFTDEIRSEITGTLNLCCAMAMEAFDKIENKTFVPIAENILLLGMNKTMNRIMKGKNEK